MFILAGGIIMKIVIIDDGMSDGKQQTTCPQ